MQTLRTKEVKRDLANIGFSYLIVIAMVLSVFFVKGSVHQVVSGARLEAGTETAETAKTPTPEYFDR